MTSAPLTRAETRAASLGGMAAIVLVGAGILVPVTALLWRGADTTLGFGFDPYLWRITRFTLWQAALSTALSILFAIPLARALARRPDFPGRVWILRLFAVPLGLPPLVAALGILSVWGNNGAINRALAELFGATPFSVYGLSGILIAHVFFNLPLAVRLMLLGLERQPQEYWKNAAVLGMGGWTTFRLIEWPAMARPAAGAAGLVFMLCVTSFTLVLILGGGPSATTLEVAIFQALRFDFDPPRAIWLALIQIALTAVALLLLRLIGGEDDRSQLLATGQERPDAKTGISRAADAVLIVAGAAFVMAPMAATLVSGLAADFSRLVFRPALWQAIATSLGIAAAAATLSILVALLLIRARFGEAGDRQPGRRALHGIAGATGSLVLLVPPVVMGAGWFLLMRGGRSSLLAPLAVIVTINAMMALPFVMRVLETAYRAVLNRNGRLALSLGVTGWHRIRRVDLPALAKPLRAAFAFAMALSLGDLGAIALFGNEKLVTLPWLLYQSMGSYRTTDAAGIALVLGVLCVTLMIFADRSPVGSRRDRR
ncbi:MAG: thiamine/thiamine pyrophosphate ABC transporter, permease protein [Rhizobiales bacterium]|nr:thiamine/thiamine pyrophosphate ABC transporter, permease protein [Hyphomicrobiales bacterium]MBA70573.1 thiamine/thiamine pyrophosphate ABC transporter, permease protein [Hyphomicrobiales bacterium]